MDMEVDLDGIFNDNITYGYDDYEYKEEPEPSSCNSVILQIVYIVVLVVGLLGNVLLLVVLAQKRRSRSSSDIFIAHLGVADIMLLGTLPFRAAQAAQNCGWYNNVVCKICGAVFNINFYCGIFLLNGISLVHYLSALGKIQSSVQKNRRLAHIGCLLVWLISLSLSIPDWIFLVAEKDQGQEKPQCIHNYSQSGNDWRLLSRLLHHIVGSGLPAAALVICWICILLEQRLQRQRPVMIILPQVVVFLLCWMPYNITLIVDTFKNSGKETPKDLPGNPEGSLKTALLFTSALGCIHACLRPLLYFLLCENFRKRLLALLRCATGESESSLWELGVDEGGRQPHQSHESHEEEQLKQLNSEGKPLGADEMTKMPQSQVI